jgi:YkoP-like protein
MTPHDRLAGLAITAFDRVYRAWHHLDLPVSTVPPVLTIAVERAWRQHRLADGTVLPPGAAYGELHLDNARVVALRKRGLSSTQVGFEFRRNLRASLTALAALTQRDARLAHLAAFSAITIFHHGLARLGFELEPNGLLAPRITGAYQHALLMSLAPVRGPRRSRCAQRLWISAPKLRALYGSLRRAS